MPTAFQQFALNAISGHEKSRRAYAMKAVLGLIEPFYAAATIGRNFCYDRGILQTRDLGRPTISVGNITTGGTGKTPVVKWLAEQLRASGHRPAILLRGYRATAGGSDEARLLDALLNENRLPKIPVQANPSRVDGAAAVLRDRPEVTHFILDDGFQHRRARRDFNLVLISATEPFGYGHVLPRGMLREPLSGLARADAFLITRCSLAEADQLAKLESFLAKHHPRTSVFHANHQQSAVWLPLTGELRPIESLANANVFLFAAIGDPAAFARQIACHGSRIRGSQWFPDHHDFTQPDLSDTVAAARHSGAELLLTTEKDWMKIGNPAAGQLPMPIGVVKLDIRLDGEDARELMGSLARRFPVTAF